MRSKVAISRIGNSEKYLKEQWLALGVTCPGPDDAVLAAIVVALAQCHVLRFTQPPRDRIAMGAARVLSVDGNCTAGVTDRDDLAAAGDLPNAALLAAASRT